jgi:hypothetical protein
VRLHWTGESVADKHVDVREAERGKADNVLVPDLVTLGPELGLNEGRCLEHGSSTHDHRQSRRVACPLHGFRTSLRTPRLDRRLFFRSLPLRKLFSLSNAWNALTVHGTLSLWPRLTRIGRGDGNGATAV